MPYGFRSLVPVTSRYPLWEQPEMPDEMRAGRGYLPDAPTGERETLVTTLIGSVPEQILPLPGPGWTAFVAALATAIVFTAITVRLPTVAVAAGVVAAAAILSWLWSMDRALLVTGLCLVGSAVFAGGALVMGWRWLDGSGLSATGHSYGAAVWLLLGYMALHVAAGIAMALWCLARLALGMIDSWRCLTLRICLLWWRFTVPAALLTLLLVAGFPHVIA